MNQLDNTHAGNSNTKQSTEPHLVEDDIPVVEEIVSVNAKGAKPQGSHAAKTVFVILCIAIVVGGLVFFAGQYITNAKQHLRESNGSKAAAGDTVDLFNPEGSKPPPAAPKLGAAAAPLRTPGVQEPDTDTIRPLRGNDGKVVVNPQGKPLGVDKSGQVVEVPAIALVAGEATYSKKQLPGQSTASPAIATGTGTAAGSGVGTPQSNAGSSPQQVQPSRYAGALFVDGSGPTTSAAPPVQNNQQQPTSQPSALELLKAANAQTAGPGANTTSLMGANAAPATGAAAARPGSVGAQLSTSKTPTTQAGHMPSQSLTLPKGRQLPCVLTTRITDELPGYTSCTLTENMYSDNGRVLLLERGSDISGEYSTSGQVGLRRLFVIWNRAKTPAGIEVDLASPGTDSLGGSGIPGFLDKRWGERLGAAFMLSIFRDALSIAVQREYPTPAPAQPGTTVVDTRPTNTLKTVDSAADAILQEGIKTRPVLSINEGELISIYVARDLDFSSVYRLRAAGANGKTKAN